MNSVADLRREYTLNGLRKSSLDRNPVEQFRIWFDQALAANLSDANAMTLATADVHGTPAARIVLLKGFDETGFSFFTNYLSAKGQELRDNPKASLLFFWEPLERQIRLSGEVVKTSREESEVYFHSRPRASQIGAHVSHQGQVIANRAELETRQIEIEKEFEGKQVPLPDYWGGYRLFPTSMEFWQGRAGRLHDRFVYTREPDHQWKIERLCP